MRPIRLLGSSLVVSLLANPALAQETTRVSVDSSGAQANGWSGEFDLPYVSADGKVVAFRSDATNLVAVDTNHSTDVFVHDRSSGITELISVDSAGVQGFSASWFPSISADGQLVAFVSDASTLVSGDTNGCTDVFVHDRSTGVTERVSVDSSGVEGDYASYAVTISADGTVVAFTSIADNLVTGDAGGHADVFVHDRVTGITERVSVDSSGAEGDGNSGWPNAPTVSADGQIVAFESDATNLIVSDHNLRRDIFVHERSGGATTRVSIRSNGWESNSDSYRPSLSADGEIVSFSSNASNLISNDTNNHSDVFVHDRSSGDTERVSVDSTGAEGDLDSFTPTISADGQLVAFGSYARNLVSNDYNSFGDVFVHDRATGETERVSLSTTGKQGNGESVLSAISADGLIVAFDSDASNLVHGDTNGVSDVLVHEVCATTSSWSNYGAGFPGTLGVPSFTSRSNPSFGSTVTLDLGNSCGAYTVGLLFVGFQQTNLHSNWGGDLLVVPALTILASLPPGGVTFSGDLPDDRHLCGFAIDLQAIEADPGAAKGVSFTPGLELVIGN